MLFWFASNAISDHSKNSTGYHSPKQHDFLLIDKHLLIKFPSLRRAKIHRRLFNAA